VAKKRLLFIVRPLDQQNHGGTHSHAAHAHARELHHRFHVASRRRALELVRQAQEAGNAGTRMRRAPQPQTCFGHPFDVEAGEDPLETSGSDAAHEHCHIRQHGSDHGWATAGTMLVAGVHSRDAPRHVFAYRPFMDWIPAVTMTSILGAILVATLLLGRKLITNWLTEWVKHSARHDFDVKLEELRAEIREGEEHLNAVRSTALAALASGQTALNQRRLQAVDDLWEATMALKSGSALVGAVRKLNMPEVTKQMSDPKVQKLISFVESFGQGFNERVGETKVAAAARPFVTPMAWALYTAYEWIVTTAWLQVKALNTGVDPIRFVKVKETIELVKAALPDFAALLDEHGAAVFPELLSDLEERLIAELRASAEGRDSDGESVERASKVARLAAKKDTERDTGTPDV
jgi:hypothetical protein